MNDMNFLPKLISALIAVESGGDPNAIGDPPPPGYGATSGAAIAGQALGCLQIHSEVIQDVNRIYNKRFTHADALNPTRAKRICELYLRHYGARRITGKTPSPEIFARIWNGGPLGYKKESTRKYWQRVKRILTAK